MKCYGERVKFVLTGKTALVTGASVGIGRGLAKALAARGVTVAIAARRVAALDELAAEVSGAGHPRPVVLEADLSKRGVAAVLAARAVKSLGQVDILVNNAGASAVGSQFGAGDNGDMRELFELNYWSPLALIQALVPAMRQRRDGAVVNVTSLSGVAPWVFTGHYSSTKAALSLASQTLRLELNELRGAARLAAFTGDAEAVKAIEERARRIDAELGPLRSRAMEDPSSLPDFEALARAARLLVVHAQSIAALRRDLGTASAVAAAAQAEPYATQAVASRVLPALAILAGVAIAGYGYFETYGWPKWLSDLRPDT